MRRVLLSLFVLGLAFSLYFLFNYRVNVESKNKVFSICLDMEEIKLLSAMEGVPTSATLKKLKESGANAVAIYALTLGELQREGRVFTLPGYEAEKHDWLAGDLKPFFTYVVVKDRSLLDCILKSIGLAIGKNRVKLISLSDKAIVEVKKDYDSTLNIPICFLKDEEELLKNMGFRVYLRIRNFRENNPDYISYIFDEMDKLDAERIIIFDGEQVLGYPSLIKEVSSEMRKRNYKMGLIEFGKQVGKEALAFYNFPNILLVHSIDAKEMLSYSVDRAISRYLRAVKERNMRILYVRFFFNLSGSLLEENAKYISDLIDSVQKAGFKLGEPAPIINYKKSYLFDSFIASGALSGITLFLTSFGRIFSFSLPLAFVSYLLFYVFKGVYLGNIALAFLIALFFPVWGAFAFMERCRKYSFEDSYFSYAKGFLVLSLYPIAVSLSAGIYIGSILGEPLFMSKILQFKGVKAAYIFPLIAVGLLAIYRERGSIRAFLKEPFMKEEFLVFLILSGVVGIYLLRSGNLPLVKPISVEREARDILDTLLYARPRFKEFLIGYPSMALFVYTVGKSFLANYRPLILMMATVASVSIVNSFCHIHTPFLFSLLRTFNGMVLGWLVGVFLILLIYLFKR
ncbi:MAG: hypothetical protein PWQ16_446 [bacterium]|nr:hypothetical protein [bacterium]